MVIEKTVDVHNYSAVLRTAEALGVQNVYLIAPPLKPGPDDTFVSFDSTGRQSKNQSSKNARKKRVWSEDVEKAKRHNGYARTACKWITLKNFNSTEACLKELREDGYEGEKGGRCPTYIVAVSNVAVAFTSSQFGSQTWVKSQSRSWRRPQWTSQTSWPSASALKAPALPHIFSLRRTRGCTCP